MPIDPSILQSILGQIGSQTQQAGGYPLGMGGRGALGNVYQGADTSTPARTDMYLKWASGPGQTSAATGVPTGQQIPMPPPQNPTVPSDLTAADRGMPQPSIAQQILDYLSSIHVRRNAAGTR